MPYLSLSSRLRSEDLFALVKAFESFVKVLQRDIWVCFLACCLVKNIQSVSKTFS
jgi:hypothetical protein